MAINLVKGQKIDLVKKNGSALNSFCVGANWGVIVSKKLFFGTKKEAVDLDLSVGLFDANNNFLDVVYYGKLKANGIHHSGDDRVGDEDGDDGLDNEVISVSLNSVDANVDQIVFVLNSFKGQDFAKIPFASIRLYEGTPSKVETVNATYNIATDEKFSGYVSMVLGKVYKHNGGWKFAAIGEPTRDKKLQETLMSVQKKFL